jgi:hypothetical protein
VRHHVDMVRHQHLRSDTGIKTRLEAGKTTRMVGRPRQRHILRPDCHYSRARITRRRRKSGTRRRFGSREAVAEHGSSRERGMGRPKRACLPRIPWVGDDEMLRWQD